MSQLPGMKKATTFSNLEVDTTFGESMQHLNSKAENPKSYQWNFEQIQSQGEFSITNGRDTVLYQHEFSLNLHPMGVQNVEDWKDYFNPKHNTIVFRCSTMDDSVKKFQQNYFILKQPSFDDIPTYQLHLITGGLNLNNIMKVNVIDAGNLQLSHYDIEEHTNNNSEILPGEIYLMDKKVCVQEDHIIYLELQGIDTEMGGIRYKDGESINYYYTTNKVEQLQVQSCSTSWKKNTVFQVSGTTKKLYLTIFGSGSGSMEIIQKTIIVPSSVIQITSINLQESTLDISGCQNLRSEYFSHVTVSESSEDNVIRMTQNQVDYFQRLSSPRITIEGSDYIFDGVVRVEVVEK